MLLAAPWFENLIWNWANLQNKLKNKFFLNALKPKYFKSEVTHSEQRMTSLQSGGVNIIFLCYLFLETDLPVSLCCALILQKLYYSLIYLQYSSKSPLSKSHRFAEQKYRLKILAHAFATKGFKSTLIDFSFFGNIFLIYWFKCWHSSIQRRSNMLPISECACGKVNFLRMFLRPFCSLELLAKAKAVKGSNLVCVVKKL